MSSFYSLPHDGLLQCRRWKKPLIGSCRRNWPKHFRFACLEITLTSNEWRIKSNAVLLLLCLRVLFLPSSVRNKLTCTILTLDTKEKTEGNVPLKSSKCHKRACTTPALDEISIGAYLRSSRSIFSEQTKSENKRHWWFPWINREEMPAQVWRERHQ